MAKVALAQFEGVDCIKHIWPMIITPKQMEKILGDIKEVPGLVLFTRVNDQISGVLITGFGKLRLPFLSLLDPVITAPGNFFGQKATGSLGHLKHPRVFI